MSPSENEFSHSVKLDEIGAGTSLYALVADQAARMGLTTRFDLLSLDSLEADIALIRNGNIIRATGQMRASLSQACIASGEAVASAFNEPITINFTPEPRADTVVEIELKAEDCDSVFHDGKAIDLGEAVAQSLALALNPYPRSAGAEMKLKAAGVKREDEVVAVLSPFSALAALKNTLVRN